MDPRENRRELDGAEFFENFKDAFPDAVETPKTTPWLYYQKLETDQREHLKLADWTPMIITFFDLLAWRLGYIQFYERPMKGGIRGPRDCIWVKSGSPERRVVIETENDPTHTPGYEVAALLTDDAPLKVLVTYHYPRGDETSEEWREEFLRTLYRTITSASTIHDPEHHEITSPVRPSGDIEFVLIVGDEVVDDPRDWRGYSLSRRGGTWGSSWTTLPPS